MPTPSFRIAACIGLILAAGAASAQSRPANLEPLPDIPPPPRLSDSAQPDEVDGTTVTVREEAETKIEEFRTKGRLYAVRVTPKIGKPYMLIDPDGKGTMTRADEIGGGVRAAQWTIFEW